MVWETFQRESTSGHDGRQKVVARRSLLSMSVCNTIPCGATSTYPFRSILGETHGGSLWYIVCSMCIGYLTLLTQTAILAC